MTKVTFVATTSLWAFVVVRAAGAVPQAPPAAASSDSTRSVQSGVYTDAQADRGKAMYVDTCARCHGKSLEGNPLENTDPMAGDGFVKSRTGTSLDSLFRTIATKMPHDDPGTLTPQEAADVIAYILKFNAFPSGKDELPADVEKLKLIRIGPRSEP